MTQVGHNVNRRGPILITGVAGFVGRHLVAHLLDEGESKLVGLTRADSPADGLPAEVDIVEVDLNDRAAVDRLVGSVRPASVYHLAAQSSVASSQQDPLGTLFNNIGGQVNLLEALVALGSGPRVLVVGSSEEYGLVSRPDGLVRETTELRPLNAYAVSKVAQDLLGYQYSQTYGLPVVRVRAFTHIGPGQEPRFATPSFARQIARIEAGLQPPALAVGNLAAQRDICDVRDVVRGYRLALQHGEPGEVYNLGSGQAVSIQSVLDQLLGQSTASITVTVDPARFRPVQETPQRADSSKLRERTGWRPTIPLEDSLAAVLDDWRERVALAGSDA